MSLSLINHCRDQDGLFQPGSKVKAAIRTWWHLPRFWKFQEKYIWADWEKTWRTDWHSMSAWGSPVAPIGSIPFFPTQKKTLCFMSRHQTYQSTRWSWRIPKFCNRATSLYILISFMEPVFLGNRIQMFCAVLRKSILTVLLQTIRRQKDNMVS